MLLNLTETVQFQRGFETFLIPPPPPPASVSTKILHCLRSPCYRKLSCIFNVCSYFLLLPQKYFSVKLKCLCFQMHSCSNIPSIFTYGFNNNKNSPIPGKKEQNSSTNFNAVCSSPCPTEPTAPPFFLVISPILPFASCQRPPASTALFLQQTGWGAMPG